MKLLLSAAAVALFAAAPAFAQDAETPSSESYYGSIGYTQNSLEVNADDADESFETDFGAVTARVGGRFGRFLGVELEGQIGVNDGDFDDAGVEGSFGLEYSGAIFAVGAFPVSPNAEIFARYGFGTAEFQAEVADEEIGGDDVFTALGVGGTYFFDGRNGVRAEYTRYDFGDDEGVETDANSFSISYVRRFP